MSSCFCVCVPILEPTSDATSFVTTKGNSKARVGWRFCLCDNQHLASSQNHSPFCPQSALSTNTEACLVSWTTITVPSSRMELWGHLCFHCFSLLRVLASCQTPLTTVSSLLAQAGGEASHVSYFLTVCFRLFE